MDFLINNKNQMNLLNLKKAGIISIAGSGGKTTLIEFIAMQLKRAGKLVILTTTTRIYPPFLISSCNKVWLWKKNIPSITQIKRQLKQNNILTIGNDLNSAGKIIGLNLKQLKKLYINGVWTIVEVDGAKGKPLKAWESYEPVWIDKEFLRIVIIGIEGIKKKINNKWIHRIKIFKKNINSKTRKRIELKKILKLILKTNILSKKKQSQISQIIIISQTENLQLDLLKKLIKNNSLS